MAKATFGIKPAHAMQIMFAVKSGFSAGKDIFTAILSVSDIDQETKDIVRPLARPGFAGKLANQ